VIAREIELCECRFVTIVIDIVHDRTISVLFLACPFPLDMLGAILVTAIGTLLMMPFREWVRWTVVPRLAEPLYRRNFALTIGNRLGSALAHKQSLDFSLPIARACWVSMWLSSDLRSPTAWVTRARCTRRSWRPGSQTWAPHGC
jgi:hypothetical protein